MKDGHTFEEIWPPRTQAPAGAYRWRDEDLDTGSMVRLWRGIEEPEIAREAVIATAAVALRETGRAASAGEADMRAAEMWRNRSVDKAA